jgi:bifunctional polynucleotide phosphatase/kinase
MTSGQSFPVVDTWIDLDLREQYRNKEMIVLVGGPGTGKSYFYKKVLQPLGYHQISLHKLGSQEKCAEEAEKSLAEESRVSIPMTTVVRTQLMSYR